MSAFALPATGPAVAERMLTEIYGASAVPRVWTTGFVKGAENWFGGRGFDRLASVDPAEGDFYFCIGLLGDAETRRSTSGIEEQPVLICDDIGTKVSVAAWDEVLNRGFPPPHFRVETSPGNQTWVWVLDRPVSRSEPDHWEDLARLRAWLVAKDLTDDVMDASRYVRLPMGVNSKDKYLGEDGVSPPVRLVSARQVGSTPRVFVGDMGSVLLEREDWRDVPLPVGSGANARVLSAAVGGGALVRVADMNDPEPIISMGQFLGQNPVQVRAGVVEALCPNIAAHSDRPETGFAFLGGGLMNCSHASCADLTTSDFKAMMVAEYEGRVAAAEALGLEWTDPKSGEGFLARADFTRRGAVSGVSQTGGAGAGSAAGAVVSGADEIGAVEAAFGTSKAEREEKLETAMGELAARFVWLDTQNAFFDLRDRCLLSTEVLDRHSAVTCWVPVGAAGGKRASYVLKNRGDMKVAHAQAYVPGAHGMVIGLPGKGTGSMIIEENDAGVRCPHVNLWRPSAVGRRAGLPTAWLELLEHVVPDKEYREKYLIPFFAMLVQKPGQRSPTVPTLVAGQGIGKDMLLSAIIRVLGEANARAVSMSQLNGGFNEYLLAQLVVLPELKLDRSGALYNQIKDWTGAGASRLTINPKYQRPFSVRPAMNFVAMSNHLDALSGLEFDDRRWAVYLSEAKRMPQDWYRRIAGELNGVEEIERLHEYLWNVDLSEFDPYAPAPDPNGFKVQMLAENLNSPATWVLEACSDGGRFAEREYLTVGEVLEAALGARAPAVSKAVTQRSVRDGLVAAGCECWGQARGGKGSKRVWLGPGMSPAERMLRTGTRKWPERRVLEAYEAEEKAAREAEESGILGGK